MDKLLCIKEVADITGEHILTVYRRIRDGEIKCIKIGRRGIRVSESDLKQWLGISKFSEEKS
ncbi:MAG TPA: helix-turn-helix domain-containing protein [Syntrophorhabdaceae bacterium]|nr:helix-turn-helix domain-containing protein [Syntrophorhabdaceae bacterium]